MTVLSRRVPVLLLLFMLISTRSFSASADWAMILAQNPQNQTALYAMAKVLNVAPELVQTRLLANDLLRNEPSTFSSEKAFFTLIGCLETLGEFRTARGALSRYMSLHPQDIKPRLSMAYDFYLEGDFHQALAWYNQVISRFPRSLDGYHGIMLSLIALKQYDRAMEYGKYILSVSPGNYFALLRMGNVLYARNEYKTALWYYSHFPDKVDFQLGMGLCHFRLRNYAQAAPLLRAAAYSYPQNSELLSALAFLNALEIDTLRRQLSGSGDIPLQQAFAKNLRLVHLYELNGAYDKAAALLKTMVTRPLQFKVLLRLAGDYSAAGMYQEAGDWYLKAVPLSTDPWSTALAAADCLLLAGNAQQAFDLLARLNQWKPVKELWPYFGRLNFLMKNRERGKIYFDQYGAEMERKAVSLSDPRPGYLSAIDCYLDAGNYSRARIILDRINAFAPGADLDWKYIRYYTEQKDFPGVLSITSKYPADPAMMNSRGWAYASLGDIRNAEKAFRNVLRRYPGNAGATAGLKYTNLHQPWELFLGYTAIGYGGYQDDRGLVTESLRYAHKRTSTTLSHTRTDVKSLSTGATDFNEDLYGGKVSYQANDRINLQLHGMAFQNDDASTNGSSVLGGKFTYIPSVNWLTGLELDFSNYNTYRGAQVSPYLGYQFNRFVRADAKGVFTTSRGSRMRASQSSTASGGLLKGTYTPNDRFLLTLGGVFGERRQAVDGDSLYAFNTLDLYGTGGFAKFVYNSKKRWQLYLSYSYDSFESEGRAAANEAAGAFLAEPSQKSSTLTTGAMYQF